MVKVTIEFPNDAWANAFVAWHLDGGGENGFYETLENALEESGESGGGEQYSDWRPETWTIRHSNKPLL